MSDFIFGVPRDVHLAHLQRERDSGEEWTGAAARVAVLLDLDRGKLRDHIGYGRQWRWNVPRRGKNAGVRNDEAGRSRVRRAWADIVRDVLTWVTFGGASYKSPLVERVPEDWWELAGIDPPPELKRDADDRATTARRPPKRPRRGAGAI